LSAVQAANGPPASADPLVAALPQLLLQPVNPSAQLIDLPLACQAQVLEQLVAVALQLALGLLFQFRGLPS
jgi:hypothetical protein